MMPVVVDGEITGASRGVRRGVALHVDPCSETTQDAPSLGFVGRRLTEVELLAGERVDPRVDDDLERLAAATDRPTGTPLVSTFRHASRVLAATMAVIDQIMIAVKCCFRW